MEEIEKKLVKGIIKLEVMKTLWSGPTNIENIRKKIIETLARALDSKTIAQTLSQMEKNGYIRSKLNKTKLRKSYGLTLEGKSLFEHTWHSLTLFNTSNINNEKLVKWMSLHFASRNVWIKEQMIEDSLRNYQAEEMLKEYSITS